MKWSLSAGIASMGAVKNGCALAGERKVATVSCTRGLSSFDAEVAELVKSFGLCGKGNESRDDFRYVSTLNFIPDKPRAGR